MAKIPAILTTLFLLLGVFSVFAFSQTPKSGYGKAIEETRCNRGCIINEDEDISKCNKAIAGYIESIRLDSNNAEAYFKRGNAYYDEMHYGKAIADFTQAIRLNPKMAEAYYAKAISDFDEAIRLNPNEVSATLRINPKYSGALNNLKVILRGNEQGGTK